MKIKKMTFLLMSAGIFLGGWNGYCEEGEIAKKTESAASEQVLKEETKPNVVIRVNSDEIDELEVLGMVNTMMPGATVHGAVDDEKQDEIKKKAYNRLIINEILAQEAIKEGIKVPKKDIEKAVKEIRKRYAKQKTTLEKVLKKSRFTLDELKKGLERDLAVDILRANKTMEFKTKAAEIWTDAYLEGYYNDNLDKFQIPEATRLSNILIRTDPSGGQTAWDSSRVRAEDIMKQLKEGKDFAELAKQYSEDIYASQGGNMGLGHQGSVIPEVESIANTLKVGEVAGPILTLFGYHIIKLEEKVPPVQMTFEQVKENLKKDRETYEVRRMTNLWLHNLRKAAKIEYLNEEDKKLMGAVDALEEPKELKADENEIKDNK